MQAEFRLLMLSAMYENGGNAVQRLLDGHPDLISYPFESQLGTRYVQDHLTSLYPVKYRWPVFALHASASEDFQSLIDEECRVRILTPNASKFRDWPIRLEEGERKARFLEIMSPKSRTRGALVEAFFRATAESWTDRAGSSSESVYVGYSPIVGVDAAAILEDGPGSHLVYVVRNPWSAYADTKKRAVPLPIPHYMTGWCVHQAHALAFAETDPDRVHILRYEDVIADPEGVLSGLLSKLGVAGSPALARPSWNGTPLSQVHPWGTIRTPTVEANAEARAELSPAETEEIRSRTRPFLSHFGYE